MESKDPVKEKKICRKLDYGTMYGKSVILTGFPKKSEAHHNCSLKRRCLKSKLECVYGGKAPIHCLMMLSGV